MKVLLVDDDASSLAALRRALQRARFTVVTACDGAEALRAFESEGGFDALVTDTDMPVMDGTQLIAAVRALRSDLPVVRLSGRPDNQAPNEERFRFSVKPISRDLLLKLMAEIGIVPPS